MATPETRLTRQILDKLDKLGTAYFFKVHGMGFHQVGISDIIGVYHGRFVALEVKTPKNKKSATLMQNHFIYQVQLAGGIAGVVRSWDEVRELFGKAGYYV